MAYHEDSGVARFVVLRPEHWRGREFVITCEREIVGRSSDCDIRFDDSTVSRSHALVTRGADGETVVSDLHSSNGTMVNEERIDGVGRGLSPGDRLRFGDVQVAFEGPAGQATRVQPTFAAPEQQSRAEYQIAAQRGSQINNVARDQHNNAYIQQVQQERAGFAREIAAARTKAKRLIVAGFLMFVLGGGTYAWAVLRFVKQVNGQINDQTGQFTSPSLFGPNVAGVPVGLIGFAVAGIGAILVVVGLVLHIVAASRRKRLETTPIPFWQTAAPTPNPW
jgi:FHA domain